MRLLIIILLFFFSTISLGQTPNNRFDTVVRKKYIDSLKYQLSLYTLSSYTYLNMYDRVAFQRDSVIRRLNSADLYISKYRHYHQKSNVRSGIIMLGAFILSFVMVTVFGKQ